MNRKVRFHLRTLAQLEGPTSSLDLSGLACLRETAAIQNKEKFLTLRRQGAKRRNQSKHQRFFRHTIGDTLNAVLDHVLAEIDKEAKSFIHQPQIGQDLFAVDRIERSDRFQLHDHEIIDDQIGAETFVEPDPIPRDRNRYLSFHGVAMFAQFMRKQDLVYDFEDAWPEPSVQAVGRVNDHSRDFILFHTAKLELLLSACEAKNLSALVSLRETSATQSQEESFTLKGECTKKTFESKTPISSQDLSGFASLREISARQGKEEFFSLRRKGAKKAYASKHLISSLDLSGFASLRETAAIQGREAFFTLRRKGAKRTDASSDRISVQNLSGFASLRETSAIEGTEKVFTRRREGAKRRNKSKHQRFFGHAIGDALDSMLDHVLAEIDEEAESLIHQPQIGQDLLAVDRIERSDRFQLYDHEIIDDQVGAETFVEPDPIPCDRNRYLSFHGVAMFAQFMCKQDFVYDFEDAWPQPSVQAVGRVNDHSRDFILFHRVKLVLLLPACEAKNPSAVVSLREASATQSQEKFFTLRRKGAKKAFESKHRISSLDLSGLASLREISARQSKEEFFTLRREGAKRTDTSNDRISVPNLSGFAPLRETSPILWQR